MMLVSPDEMPYLAQSNMKGGEITIVVVVLAIA
jgi:hypothetical protein